MARCLRWRSQLGCARVVLGAKVARHRLDTANSQCCPECSRLDGRWCFCDTKRSRSRRPIKLQRWIVALLRDLQTKASAHSLCPEGRDLVFKTASGHPIHADYLAKHFKMILELAGLPRIRLYDLRHSAATIALAAGVSPKVVSEQLGHASTAFTLDTYAHVLPHMQDEAAARIEAMLFGEKA